jgi:putative peptide zinc metalloprotease protein
MVLVPSQTGAAGNAGPAAPSWVFPFDRPAAPAQDGNESLAVNTTDGSVVYDVAFALVWADDGEDMQTRNEAYAFASCADCSAVAVGFQVVLIVGQTDVIVPENLSAAANYNCLRCLTYALADQLVLTLEGPLSADGTARLNELWQQIADFGRNLQRVPLSEIQGRLNGFKQQIMDVIKSDPNARPGSPGGPAVSPTATPSRSPTPGTTAPAGQATQPGPRTSGTASSRPVPASTAPGTPTETAPAPAPAGPQPTQPAGTATQPAATPTAGFGAASTPTASAPPAP